MAEKPNILVCRRNKFVDSQGLDDMTDTQSHAKKRASKLTAAEKKDAQIAANRKAQLQWWILGGGLTAAFIGAIVLISVFTEGELPSYG